jgi:hypothetical protein
MKRDFNFWNTIKQQHGNAVEIARATGINVQTVYWHLKKHGISSGPKSDSRAKCELISSEELIGKYLELKSLVKLGEFYGVSKEALRHRIPPDLLEDNRCARILCNEDFFANNNELSFYYAGFLAADGCLKLKGGRYKQVQLCLAASDGEEVRKFARALNYNSEVKDYTLSEVNKLGENIVRTDLQISSDKLFDDLHRFGLTVRKAHTFAMPEWLIQHPLVHHFLRGYFDGDGSTYTTVLGKNRTIPQVYLNIRGTEEFLSQMRDLFDTNITNGKWKRGKAIRFNNGIGVLEYGGNTAAMSIADYLYRGATVWMERKRAKFEEARSFAASAPEARSAVKRGKPNVKRRRPIIATNIATGEEHRLAGAPEAVEKFAVSYAGVHDCISGRQNQHRGWKFRYDTATNI